MKVVHAGTGVKTWAQSDWLSSEICLSAITLGGASTSRKILKNIQGAPSTCLSNSVHSSKKKALLEIFACKTKRVINSQ